MPHVMTQVEKVRRAEQLREDIKGAFALGADANARGDFATGANFMRQVDELREELEGLS